MADAADNAYEATEHYEEQGIAAVRDQLAGDGQGWCDECGVDIPEGRRKAMPNAIRCAPCQEVVDVKQGGYRRG